MESNRPRPKWELYERLVARLVSDQLSTGYCVTPNARVIGAITGTPRQIDVLIDLRQDTNNHNRVIIDTKAQGRPVDVIQVEAFRGLMQDVDATHGYLVCANGYTATAERRAQESVSMRLLPLDRLENFNPSTWPKCMEIHCHEGRVFWDGYPSVEVSLAPVGHPTDQTPQRKDFVHYVGKCDRCSRFHVKCLTCGEMLSLDHESEDEGTACKCKMPWFWIASIEQDDQGRRSAELHFITATGTRTATRRSL